MLRPSPRAPRTVSLSSHPTLQGYSFHCSVVLFHSSYGHVLFWVGFVFGGRALTRRAGMFLLRLYRKHFIYFLRAPARYSRFVLGEGREFNNTE